jgi:hypothetical protein
VLRSHNQQSSRLLRSHGSAGPAAQKGRHVEDAFLISNSRRVFDLNEAVKTDQIKQTNAIMVRQGETIPSPNQCG